ncbi:MAG: DUF2023 family protein [bacterium]
MSIFNHHIYEYKKGLRNLILYTAKKQKKLELTHKFVETNPA